ncbi:MAG: hypothetical protein A3C93_01960 [Candidatus Lloydbacteria bacterium RIFCSPHIGHO2_02_FULL_54_17]|uniref:Teneurin-like YD-shell domain-containing protein n=1 Tax=Candidatus Lloydbacteria bacterium RIFCSPHIGHO2_02_FULL_54_17 TaxID=1798664 RepID=A0A1G2DCA2_9BACT|nr:MAG: hypothetical protein A3C93_01960 [Candidatus Lloydbacteria bacterium RIFCSPHIGHO2_02_FULL_54_17]OGZ14748.1 MAG: hypothetical protein A2948_04605 [Candidatus Lloydbacteria bacterium RIFCSPLOWO2_01_FULL_54_18]OGZ17027.1 MAG: hypothetical protein A3H76_06870 [Candidatus Lloydbacteria bacterium RIFCSPLOWO2_02_FULL_54_12]
MPLLLTQLGSVVSLGGLFLTLMAGALPVVPEDMRLVYSFAVPTAEVNTVVIPAQEVFATSTGESVTIPATTVPREHPLSYTDDESGMVYFSVFKDNGGNAVFVQITGGAYQKMGLPGGTRYNTKASEYRSLFDTLTPRAEAADTIAFDKVYEVSVNPGTSITFNHQITSTTSNPILFVGFLTDLSGTESATYDGESMTLVNSVDDTPDGQGIVLFRLDNPSLGDNNLVVNGTNFIYAKSASYTGAECNGAEDAQNTGGPTVASSLGVSVTTTADHTWQVEFGRSLSGSMSAGSGTTFRDTTEQGMAWMDSNGPKTPAGSATLNFNNSVGTHKLLGALASFEPFTTSCAAGGGSAVATTTLQDLSYTYDTVGNITGIEDHSGTHASADTVFTYDNLYRLTSASTTNATTTDWKQTYTYNDLGNITTKSDVGSYTYAGTGFANPHAPTTINSVDYTYDKAGNLTSAGSAAYTWNYRNRLTETNNAGTTTQYTYDVSDQRVTQAVNRGGSTTTTTYWNNLYETTGATTTLYVFLPDGTLLATVEGNGTATSTHVAHTDHLNSTNVVSNSTGVLAQLATYYPFGAKRNNELPASGFRESRLFISQYDDLATSLNYLNARYYDGGNGKFISQDPVARDIGMMQKMPVYILMTNQGGGTLDQTAFLSDPQMANSYSYSVNNPINKSDPSGLWYKEFATGQQSWPSFQMELGQAAQQMSQDSPAWNYALDNPYKTSVGVAGLSTLGAISGSLGIATAPSIVAPGVGTTYAVGRAISTAYYLNSAQSNLNIIGTALYGAGSAPAGSSAFTIAKAAGSAVVTQKVNAVTSAVNSGVSMTVNAYNSALTQIQSQINYIQVQINILSASMKSSAPKK